MDSQQELTTYIALFHFRDHAAAALRDLQASGFTSDALTVIGGGNGSSYSDAKGSFGSAYGYGEPNSLSEIGVPDRDRDHLQKGLNSGGTVLVLQGAGSRADEIEKIFHKHSTIKIDETDVEQGGYAAPVVATTGSKLIPVVEEELVVGKREVDRGGVRVFQRMVETPVSASVTLHEEHVVIERRPVNRAVTEADLLQANKSLELTETAEEAVVGKSAHVVEEVLVGRQSVDRTATVRDTVRHTEVEIEPTGATDFEDTTKLRTN